MITENADLKWLKRIYLKNAIHPRLKKSRYSYIFKIKNRLTGRRAHLLNYISD